MSNIITITGDLGSGKTTIASRLAEYLHIDFVSTGIIQRDIASKYGMNTLELNKYAENNPKIDDEIDGIIKNLGKANKDIVVDSRLAWFFLGNSLKIYLFANIEVAAKRIMSADNRKEEKYDSIEHAIRDIKARRASEDSRFKSYYGADCRDLNNFDIIIDTSFAPISYIFDIILKNIDNWRKNLAMPHCWLSPKNIYPTQNIVQIAREDAKEILNSIKEFGYQVTAPVSVAEYKGYLFIVDGHKRVSASIFQNLTLIPAKLVANDQNPLSWGSSVKQFVQDHYKPSWIYDWEDAHKFRFYSYFEQ
ncbi:MAG: cytidylate kinase family protein [Deltaproteobacteria bacterium]|nr:cytidylate kinase family protein [Deltaproteobacteria bacterium]